MAFSPAGVPVSALAAIRFSSACTNRRARQSIASRRPVTSSCRSDADAPEPGAGTRLTTMMKKPMKKATTTPKFSSQPPPLSSLPELLYVPLLLL